MMWDFVIRGARGTVPGCGSCFGKYGGNTTCYTLQTDKGLIIVDAGTGIAHVAREIAGHEKKHPITFLFTHFHMDHIIGFPCFYPLYDKQARIRILGDPRRRDNWKTTLKTFMGKPYWPVGLGDTDARMTLKDLPVTREAIDIYGARISWFSVPHPQQCLAYRVEWKDQVVVIATDVEYEAETVKPAFINFCQDADVLIFDAQYTPDEYPAHRGWGHSTWKAGTAIASRAGAKRLILTHHSPGRSDRALEALLKEAKKEFPKTALAYENMNLTC